jgi:hypothetical protein
MATTKAELLQAVQDNYTEALKNEPHDLAAANTVVEVAAIQANVATARQAYYTSLATELAADNSDVQAAFEEVKRAMNIQKEARAKTGRIADILDKLANATTAVQKMLALAK